MSIYLPISYLACLLLFVIFLVSLKLIIITVILYLINKGEGGLIKILHLDSYRVAEQVDVLSFLRGSNQGSKQRLVNAVNDWSNF